VEAILLGVAERMGLTSFSMLFEAYASQIAYSIRQAGLDFLQFPPHLLGYQDRRECAAATFRAFTPTNVLAGGPKPEAIAHGQKLFANHCKVIQKSQPEGIRECFGDIVGFQIVSWIDEHVGYPESKDLDKLLKAKAMPANEVGTFDDLLQQNVDGIAAAILRTLCDQDSSQEGTIAKALRSLDESGKATQAFQAMAYHRRADDFSTHSPNLPAFNTATVLQAFNWFKTRVPDVNTKATTYHVLHELFANAQHSPLVNEQIRLVNAVSLWVALHYDDFEESTLLHTLLHGATSLLAQSDLARAAQSILEWAFTFYRRINQKDLRLPDVLIRICCLAHDYTLNTQDAAIADMGNDLLRWVDGQAFALCKLTAHRGQVVKALPAWPHKPSPELAEIYEDITSESLSAVLGDIRISSNKFRLVRRLRDLAALKAYDENEFAKTDFWRLKECIPLVTQLQDEDIDAFSTLLVLHKGHIDSFGSDQQNSQTVRARHRRGRKKGPNASDDSSPQYSITIALLTMLDGNAASQVHVAYRTLRLLMSVSNSDLPPFQFWPFEHQMELNYLQTYRRIPGTRPLRDMNELSSLEVYLDTTREFPKWVTMVTTLLSDILAITNAFYAQLTSILQSDIAFAEQMLPVLVHTVLHAEAPMGRGSSTSCRTLLSSYFTSVLTCDTASTSCLRSIVDIVLHLRNFRPTHISDALAYDRWLDIDYTLLARSATACGAYTTALLFLELASEYRSPEKIEDATAEQILFDIYSHIDEPDGFYGIKTKDLQQFLTKRFHHERQWEKAFRFHGAALEAGNTDSHEAEGLLQSFHSFGFNHLAIDSLQSSSIGAGSIFNASSMSYHLGWRTETWDLPDQTEPQNTGASLYLALRAIHRERDPKSVDSVLRRALSKEMGRLRELGAENHAEIREVVQSLMCLSQVTQWRETTIQDRLRSKCIDIRDWSDFIHLDPDFE
jgi:ataxia telangiectasia mutated family protein